MTTTALHSERNEESRPLPDGWLTARLKTICKEIYRYPSFYGMDHLSSGIPVIRGEHINETGEVSTDWTDYWFVSQSVSSQYPRTILEEGDLVFTVRGTIGKVGIIRKSHHGAQLSPNLIRISPSSSVDSLFLWHYLRSIKNTTEAVEDNAVTIATVKASDLVNLEIPLPPLDEQRRIAAILTHQLAAVERARAAAQAQLAAAEALPAAYLQEVFENLGQWPVRRLGDLLKLRKDVIHPYNNPSGLATFVGLEHVEPGTGIRVGSESVEMSKLTGRKPQFYQGDIVYGYLRPYLNKVWIAEFDGLCSVDQYVYSVDQSQASVDFIAWFMRSSTYLKRAPIKTTPGQLPRIRTEEVATVEIDLPPLEEQQRIVTLLKEQMTSVGRTRQAVQTQLDGINQLPAALLRQAFNGEL